jgi:phenylacetate-CoA ligase
MQVMDPYVWVESLSVAKGECSSILVTDLTNFSSPLIRYATGDEGRVVKGSDGVYLTGVTGRVHDQIQVKGTTYPTHWFQDMFTRLGNVDDFQFVRSTDKPLELRICLIDIAGEQAMREKLSDWLGSKDFNLLFVKRHEFIRVGQQQKFRYLVDIDQQQPPKSSATVHLKNLFEGSDRNKPYLYVSGWNDAEIYGEISFRWMRKCGVIAINPRIASESLTIEYDYPTDAPAMPMLTFNYPGAKIHEEEIRPGYNRVTMALPSNSEAGNIVNIEVSALYPVPGDTRELGLKVHKITVL